MAIDRDQALSAMDGNTELLKQLAQIFVEDAPQLACDFDIALDADDFVDARQAAHSLKGLVSSFYNQPAVDQLASIERACVGRDQQRLANASTQISEIINDMTHEMQETGMLDAMNANRK
jgi:two-component system, sensor histidine kinase and response regulator